MKHYAQMTPEERATANHRAAELLEKIGGGFASALARAYFVADGTNQARILGTFPDLFERYRTWAAESAPADN